MCGVKLHTLNKKSLEEIKNNFKHKIRLTPEIENTVRLYTNFTNLLVFGPI